MKFAARFAVFFSYLLLFSATAAMAIDEVTVRRGGRETEVVGRVLGTAQDGGVLLLARDGELWQIPPQEQIRRAGDAQPFEPLSRDEYAKRLLQQLPPGFEVHATRNYLIFHNTSPAYAQWCGALLEKLYGTFTNLWTRLGFELHEPAFPLAAVIFADRPSYLKYSNPELGEAGEAIIGYYSLLTNRMTMYDLTGSESQGRNRSRTRTSAQINAMLDQPDAWRNVSTIVHEATHQIAFNCGLHERLSDCPRWFAEGIAVYFESPDLKASKGWRGGRDVKQSRLEHFMHYLPRRPADSLETLIRDDARFLDPKLTTDAYAECWALTYFLIQMRKKDYIGYLKMLSEKKPLLMDKPDQRIQEFRHWFGDLQSLDAEFLRYMSKIR